MEAASTGTEARGWQLHMENKHVDLGLFLRRHADKELYFADFARKATSKKVHKAAVFEKCIQVLGCLSRSFRVWKQ